MKSTTLELDRVDFRILEALAIEGRMSDVALGEMINLSSTAVARRRRLMEEAGIITGYTANLSLQSLGFSGVVIVMIELRSQAEDILDSFEQEVIKCPSISYCGFISGDTDFLIMIHVSSLDEYDEIYRRELSNLPHVAKIRSSFVLREVARRSTVPIIFERGKKMNRRSS
ncbi:DNA-binding Lrp family transcriptional regulator [Blastomonas natatoria]|uniref:DNA-binding Lrp family transcriptional regulator n=1 Tax=Blastomonas natatoria TaxID=34015 RepID=A0A2V3UPS4_9SPHN|nr:Lrp/AsnC family transcriptional regulator [Blastomonas natatoria]PXW68494.1 DNA-binding Lrp family transcriptional regulator [Blastomonas natatoria]